MFDATEIIFLGHMITQENVRPDPQRAAIIQDCKQPQTFCELCKFLGMIHFYRRHMKHTAENQSILNDYLKCAKKNDNCIIEWTAQAIQ